MDLFHYIHNNHLKIIVKPNSPKTEIIGYDSLKDALMVDVHAKPEGNKANIEILKLFSKILKTKVKIKGGLRSKVKILKIE